MNFDWIRKKLEGKAGKNLWRSVEEVAETPEFMSYLKEEFPNGSAQEVSPESRREFLKLMGASLLLAAMPGCSPPREKIVPYVRQPEEIIPGKPLYFATGMSFNRHTTGLLVESHMGRPTKIDGNPEHIDSHGATSLFHQAAILGLYDPDRSKVVLKSGQAASWKSFTSEVGAKLQEWRKNGGEGFRILTGTVVSPTLGAQIKNVLAQFPKAKWHQYNPVNIDQSRRAQRASFGEFADPLYDFSKAEIILSIGSNFLIDLPGSIRYAREFAKGRQAHERGGMNRLYVIEADATLTGAAADHALRTKVSKMTSLTEELAELVGVKGIQRNSNRTLSADDSRWISEAAKDLRAAGGKSLVIAGESLPARIQALTYAINDQLGNTGKTVRWIEPIEQMAELNGPSIAELTADMRDGKVSTLLVMGSNPGYSTPSDLNFSDHLRKVPFVMHHGLYLDETGASSHWHIPATHFLEHFSDGRASDGTATMIQPLIMPLYDGISEHELLAFLVGESGTSAESAVQAYWKNKLGLDFTKGWRKALHDGFVEGTASTPKNLVAKADWNSGDLKASATSESEWEITFRPDESIWDGEFSNNAWLQELPKPFTKLTWDNAAIVSPASAQKLGVRNGDLIEIKSLTAKMTSPIYIVPGHAEGTISLSLGYGRTFGQIAKGHGFNAYALQTLSSPAWLGNVTVSKTGHHYKLASTQLHQSMEDRELVRSASLATFLKNPEFARVEEEENSTVAKTSFYAGAKREESPDYAWGMAVNLNSCIGCNACVISCNSENNIAVVGKNEVANGREMHWIRIDHYYEGNLDDAKSLMQPVMCQHCENAPCEPVCPVGATTHSPEGINEMAYNRCVGTRYCSNNCPYKVRRFNFLAYTNRDKHSEALKLMHNPDVTVRNRGVMEKCTFCVQRVNQARITAKKEERLIRDGEVKTACQVACPTEAITFGNIKDPESALSKLRALPISYRILTDLATFPRVNYLAKIKNLNAALTGPEEGLMAKPKLSADVFKFGTPA